MNSFVLIFRQGKPVTEAEKQRRAETVPQWAREQNAAGRSLEPRILGPEKLRRGAELPSSGAIDAWPVTALLFIQAKDLDDAAAVAASHPAVQEGLSVEVRPWGAPAAVAR